VAESKAWYYRYAWPAALAPAPSPAEVLTR